MQGTAGNPESYLKSEEDGLPIRTFDKHVKEKLFFVNRYIDMFEKSMRLKPWRNRRYIDFFAGSGKCRIKGTQNVVLGSALLALMTKYPFTDYLFIDADEANINSLRMRAGAVSPKLRVRYEVGDSNHLVHTIVPEWIQRDQEKIDGRWWSINLAFLDPNGLELEWSTVEALAQLEKMDLIIHYSVHGLNRSMKNMADMEEANKIDRFFGDDHWRTIYKDLHNRGYRPKQMHRPLMDYYKSKLVRLGYIDAPPHDSPEPLIRRGGTKLPYYRLLFASKDSLAVDFWRKNVSKDLYGQQALPL